MLKRASRRGQALLIVLAFIAAFALILWATAFFASGSFLAQRSTISDTKATYTVDAALQWGLAYLRLNPPACTSGPLTPAIPAPGPAVNGYTPTLTISPDASCTPGAPVFNLVAQAGPRTGQAQAALGAAYVQGAAASTGAAPQIASAFPASVVRGHTVIVAVTVAGASVASVTDTAVNTYAKALANLASDGTEVSIWSASNVTGGALTVTASFSAIATGAIALHEYLGLATAGTLDQVAGAAGNSVNVWSGATPATTQASELVFGAVGDRRTGVTYAPGTGFAGRQSTSVNADIATEDKVVSATGTQTATFRASAGGTRWSCVVATFKATGWTLNWYLLQ